MQKIILSELEKRFSGDADVAGAIAIPALSAGRTSLEATDLVVMVLSDRELVDDLGATYMIHHFRIKEVWMSFSRITVEVLSGEHPWVIHWLLEGERIYDPTHKVQQLCSYLDGFPTTIRHKKNCIEFSKLLRYHVESKSYLKKGHNLDAFVSIQHSLQHWARLAVMDAGKYPQVHLWRQVRELNPGVYKLYKELLDSGESVEKRSRLVLLATEYAVLSHMKDYCTYLFCLLEGEAWSVKELTQRLQRDQVEVDLGLLLDESVKRSHVEEISRHKNVLCEQRYRLVRP